MKRSKFSETAVLGILKAVENGRTVAEVCRERSISESTYFNWKAKYGGMTAGEIKRLRELEARWTREPFSASHEMRQSRFRQQDPFAVGMDDGIRSKAIVGNSHNINLLRRVLQE